MKRKKVSDKALLQKRQELGQELKWRRLAAKLTQEALADVAGVSKKAIAQVESGKAEYPSDQFFRYCMAMDVPILPLGFDVVIPESIETKKPFDVH